VSVKCGEQAGRSNGSLQWNVHGASEVWSGDDRILSEAVPKVQLAQ